jgi:hypothetical protein
MLKADLPPGMVRKFPKAAIGGREWCAEAARAADFAFYDVNQVDRNRIAVCESAASYKTLNVISHPAS